MTEEVKEEVKNVEEIKKEEKAEEAKEDEREKIKDILFDDEIIQEERIIILNLRDSKKAPRNKRAKKAVKLLRELVKRFTKRKEIWIDNDLNMKIWERGIRKPPKKVKVKVLLTNKDRAFVFKA